MGDGDLSLCVCVCVCVRVRAHPVTCGQLARLRRFISLVRLLRALLLLLLRLMKSLHVKQCRHCALFPAVGITRYGIERSFVGCKEYGGRGDRRGEGKIISAASRGENFILSFQGDTVMKLH